MKRLALVLILALVLTLIFSTSVLADNGNGPGNMPEKAADHLLDDVRGYGFGESDGKLINGLQNPGRGYVGYGVINNAWGVITIIAERGNPPGQGW